MKLQAFVAVLLFLGSAVGFAEERRTLLKCVPASNSAPVYTIELTDGEPGSTYLVKNSIGTDGPSRSELLLSDYNQVWGYGHTFIITENFGRSGYAHVYANVETGATLIDVNVFLNNAINTDGPQTDYRCEDMLD